ncbi:urease accessory protein [Nitrosospira multiformis]|uniref:Urease accessory protein UreD n=1 Tax=Nitrosospira multiformis TaxID=1231 RepID=A0A1H8BPQ2_9PROT|nr:urease accessory protein [Nitrosospira multiformis]
MSYSGSASLKSGAKTHLSSLDENSTPSSGSIATLCPLPSSGRPLDPKVNLAPDSPLRAHLRLKFAESSGITRMVERDHHGPLLVQKPLYPEGYEVCQAVVIHPPGGVVAGDELGIQVHVGPSAHAQITSPGATKWYKSTGRTARQHVYLQAEAGGVLEWMPQETIFFNNARVMLDHQVELEKDSVYMSCEILCFGRTAFGESFNSGEIKQHTSIRQEGKLVWFEKLRLEGGSKAMNGRLALAGRTVCATFIMSGKPLPAQAIDLVREEAARIGGESGQVGISQFKSLLVARFLGDSSEVARHVMLCIWRAVRPITLGRPAIVPRSWNT